MPARRQKVVGVAIVSLGLLTVVIVPFSSDRIVSPTTGEEEIESEGFRVLFMSQQTAGGVEAKGNPFYRIGSSFHKHNTNCLSSFCLRCKILCLSATYTNNPKVLFIPTYPKPKITQRLTRVLLK
jgi:hypothetical protein